jgi:hypothetical protein
MNYMLMIYSDPNYTNTPEEMQQYFAVTDEMRKAGVYVTGEQLHPITAATSVRASGGTNGVVTDGPFAETREFLGGFYILDCKDLDEAIVFAKKLNAIDKSTVEIRPTVDFSAS